PQQRAPERAGEADERRKVRTIDELGAPDHTAHPPRQEHKGKCTVRRNSPYGDATVAAVCAHELELERIARRLRSFVVLLQRDPDVGRRGKCRNRSVLSVAIALEA